AAGPCRAAAAAAALVPPPLVPPAAHGLGRTRGTDLPPAGSAAALGPGALAQPCGDPQVFQGADSVLAQQPQSGLLGAGTPLPRLPLRLGRPRAAGRVPALAPLFPAREPVLRLGHGVLRLAGGAWVLPCCARCRAAQDLQPHSPAGLAPGGWERLWGHLPTAARGVPARRFLGHRDGLGRAEERATPAQGHPPIVQRTSKPVSRRAPPSVSHRARGEGPAASAALPDTFWA